MDTTILVATINCLATIAAAFVAAIATIVGVKVTNSAKRVNKAEQSVVEAKHTVAKAEESIKEFSENLPSWHELFEHDEEGKPIKGNIEHLIEAVYKGYPIKIRIHKPNETGIQVMDAQLLSIEDKVVSGSNTDQISQMLDASGDMVYQDKAYHYYVIASSNGVFHQKRIFMDGTPGKTTKIKRHMTWIGLVPPTKPD